MIPEKKLLDRLLDPDLDPDPDRLLDRLLDHLLDRLLGPSYADLSRFPAFGAAFGDRQIVPLADPSRARSPG